MSNEELKTLSTRMELEKRYRDLNKVEVSAGKKMVAEILMTATKETLQKEVNAAMAKGMKSVFSMAMNTAKA